MKQDYGFECQYKPANERLLSAIERLQTYVCNARVVPSLSLRRSHPARSARQFSTSTPGPTKLLRWLSRVLLHSPRSPRYPEHFLNLKREAIEW